METRSISRTLKCSPEDGKENHLFSIHVIYRELPAHSKHSQGCWGKHDSEDNCQESTQQLTDAQQQNIHLPPFRCQNSSSDGVTGSALFPKFYKQRVLEFLSWGRNCKTLLYANTFKKTVLFRISHSRFYVRAKTFKKKLAPLKLGLNPYQSGMFQACTLRRTHRP